MDLNTLLNLLAIFLVVVTIIVVVFSISFISMNNKMKEHEDDLLFIYNFFYIILNPYIKQGILINGISGRVHEVLNKLRYLRHKYNSEYTLHFINDLIVLLEWIEYSSKELTPIVPIRINKIFSIYNVNGKSEFLEYFQTY